MRPTRSSRVGSTSVTSVVRTATATATIRYRSLRHTVLLPRWISNIRAWSATVEAILTVAATAVIVIAIAKTSAVIFIGITIIIILVISIIGATDRSLIIAATTAATDIIPIFRTTGRTFDVVPPPMYGSLAAPCMSEASIGGDGTSRLPRVCSQRRAHRRQHRASRGCRPVPRARLQRGRGRVVGCRHARKKSLGRRTRVHAALGGAPLQRGCGPRMGRVATADCGMRRVAWCGSWCGVGGTVQVGWR